MKRIHRNVKSDSFNYLIIYYSQYFCINHSLIRKEPKMLLFLLLLNYRIGLKEVMLFVIKAQALDAFAQLGYFPERFSVGGQEDFPFRQVIYHYTFPAAIL